jgi:predicted DsbA family dithiol-disulfide isomerase
VHRPTPISVDIWSDIACPWCHVGKRRFEAALARFPQREAVDVTWRAFELDPGAPPVLDPNPPYVERLARKYRTSTAGAQQMLDTMTASAAGEGLDFRFDIIRPGNTFDAHRLIHLATERGLGGEAKERLLRAYLGEGVTIGDRDELARLGEEIGLEVDLVRTALASDRFAEAVRDDERTAAAHGIRAVPFFVFDRRLGVSGAQPVEVLLQTLERVWASREVRGADASSADAARGDQACGPDGCTIPG